MPNLAEHRLPTKRGEMVSIDPELPDVTLWPQHSIVGYEGLMELACAD